MSSSTDQTPAVLFEKESRSARFGSRELPAPGPDDVLVESRVVGLCRSDIELLEGHLDAQLDIPYPVVPGHEWSGQVVEVEVTSLAELDEALAAGATLILLDNFSTSLLRDAVEHTAGRARLEASGGITLANLAEVAATGVDFISLGALTHSAGSLDFSLEVRQ